MHAALSFTQMVNMNTSKHVCIMNIWDCMKILPNCVYMIIIIDFKGVEGVNKNGILASNNYYKH